MLWKTLLIVHICGATIGLLSGYTAMVLRKGSGWHGAAGTVFFVSMLTMSSTGGYIAAFFSPNMLNLMVSTLTFYLVATSWRAARQRTGGRNAFDFGALLVVLTVGVTGIVSGFEAVNSPTGTKDRMPAPAYFVFGVIALLCTSSDVRMLVRGGAVGARRIARHLWRMCLALLIATFSLYPGQAKLFPMWIRQTNLLWIPHLLLIAAMFYALYRVSLRKRVPPHKGMDASVAVAVPRAV